jgi:hypothetical protein
MKFFNNLFSMSIEVIRDNMKDETEGTDEVNKPTGQRRVQVNQQTAEEKPAPTRERKGSALQPSEPTVQEATEE